MKVVRRYFPYAHISLGTNGILLLQQNADFWETCRDQKIDICINYYPIKINHDEIENKCKQYNVDIFDPGADKENGMFRFAIDLKGACDGKYNFFNCMLAEGCLALRNGKLYPCPIVGNVYKFNRFFNTNIPVTDSDSIDIYKVINLEEILNFLAKPIPFCNFCNLTNVKYNLDWETSKKSKDEWSNQEDIEWNG
jgi:hypothetical protein